MSSNTVLVTGGSGFLGAHCIVQLLNAGYFVRTTIRSASREADVRAMVRVGGITDDSSLSFAIADLMNDARWGAVVSGCDYVLHTASPFSSRQPEDENDLIIPARDGALRVLRAARDSGVRRVVMTSSFAAVGYSPKPVDQEYTEADWTNPDQAGLEPYIKSKTIAERAAWDFMKNAGNLELTVINPTGIFGPALGPDFSSSLLLLKNMLDGTMTVLPDVSFGVVDVRDVADAHLKAMTHPAAGGERFITVAGPVVSLYEIAVFLKKHLGQQAEKVSAQPVPNEQSKRKLISNAKARQVLDWLPRSSEDAIVAAARSLLEHGSV